MIRKRKAKLFAIAAAVAFILGLGVTVAPVASAEVRIPLANGLTVIMQDRGPDGSRSVRTQGVPRVGDYVTQVINVRFPDGNQFERNIDAANQLSDTFILASNQTDVSVQACRPFTFEASKCTGWSAFKNEAPVVAPPPDVKCEPAADFEAPTVPAGQQCKPKPKPMVACPEGSPTAEAESLALCAPVPDVTNAIQASFGDPSLSTLDFNVTNTSKLEAKCDYTATANSLNPLVPKKTTRTFNVPANGNHTESFSGAPTFTTYNVVLSCHDASGKQIAELGHVNTSVTW